MLWMVYRIYWHGFNLSYSRIFIYLRLTIQLWRSAGRWIFETRLTLLSDPVGMVLNTKVNKKEVEEKSILWDQ